eukprot:12180741-Alexandrium_andersonii.AAC.1
MSASLVGSEMCIRDRHGCGPTKTRRAQRLEPAMGRTEARKAGEISPPSPCLLYTSDAADDM